MGVPATAWERQEWPYSNDIWDGLMNEQEYAWWRKRKGKTEDPTCTHGEFFEEFQ